MLSCSVGRTIGSKRAKTHRWDERNYKVCISIPVLVLRFLQIDHEHREDDTNWPKKNIVGKQELEIRIGNDHIAFEVRSTSVRSSSYIHWLQCYFLFTSGITLLDLLLLYSLQTAKIGALVDIQDSEDPEGLRVFYYLVQDLKVSTSPCAGCYHFLSLWAQLGQS
jgi:hypothetical protein